MSLGIVIKGPEGLVLAAESRVTLQVQEQGQAAFQVSYDNATKLFGFSPPHDYVGVVTYGLAVIGQRTAFGYLPEFEASLGSRVPVEEFARKLEGFYMGQWNTAAPPGDYRGPPMTFLVAGFNAGEPYGRVYEVTVPPGSGPKLLSENANFTISFGGQTEIADRIMRGFDSRIIGEINGKLGLSDAQKKTLGELLPKYQLRVPLDLLSLQDCIDLGVLFFSTTMAAQALTVGVRGVGGETDIVVIARREGFRFIQRKALRGTVGTAGG